MTEEMLYRASKIYGDIEHLRAEVNDLEKTKSLYFDEKKNTPLEFLVGEAAGAGCVRHGFRISASSIKKAIEMDIEMKSKRMAELEDEFSGM